MGSLETHFYFPQTESIALSIWHFVYEKYQECSPKRIAIYHHIDGTLHIQCDEAIFFSLRYYSLDKTLLEKISFLAEKYNMNGKMYLYSSSDFLNVLDFKFSYC